MVTAETAVLAPVVALGLALGAWMMSLAHLQVRLIDASRDAARLVARGESPADAARAVRRTLPGDVQIQIRETTGDYVTVRVTGRSQAPLHGLSWELSATSTCLDES